MHPPNSLRPKWLTVAQLERVLENMPSNLRLIPNPVGNLAVMGDDGKFIGYIDFLDEGTFEHAGDDN